nr:snake venom metalloproteinases P-III precursor [Rhamphiophis oxyrhynchus]
MLDPLPYAAGFFPTLYYLFIYLFIGLISRPSPEGLWAALAEHPEHLLWPIQPPLVHTLLHNHSHSQIPGLQSSLDMEKPLSKWLPRVPGSFWRLDWTHGWESLSASKPT